ncbi:MULTISPECIES: hypothetical protein [unclassified Frankia]|uniref:hypothetical protein n=1 Tax=unclassified Frankia TaxID=2632575 RepID=UPI0020248673
MRPRLGTTLTTIATVGTLSIAGVTAVALASPGSPTNLISPAGAATTLSPGEDSSKDTTTLDSDQPRHRHHHWHGGPGWWGYDGDGVDGVDVSRPLHGDATVRTDDGYQVITYQRGELTSLSQTSVTISSKDGYKATYAVTGDTDLWADGDDAGIGDFRTGTTVVVAATVDGDTRTAEHLAELPD